MYRVILIATDGSDLAGNALEHGLQLAKTVGAKVIVVTVTEPWSTLGMASEVNLGNLDAIQDFEEAATRSAKAILADCADKATSLGVTAETRHVNDRRPSEGILQIAEQEDCDLIIMASHGRQGVGRILLGSQTAEVLAHTKRPVLVLR